MRSHHSLTSLIFVAACGGDDDHHHHHHDAATTTVAHTLVVAGSGTMVGYDIATGDERPGTVTNVAGPVDLQSLDDGHVIVNLAGSNEILVVDTATMLEVARIPSSAADGISPVHGYLSPDYDGARYWIGLNDGDDTAASNSARIVDVAAGSDTRFEAVGEFPLGIGHHKAAYSATQPRIVVSNISDCDNVLSVYDLSDPSNVTTLATLTADEASFPGCNPDIFNVPAPHGCATSSASGKAYCSITGSGQIGVVDIDAATPTFTLLDTDGGGGGYTRAHPAGRYIYTMQETPREGDGGDTCGIGQVVVTDAMTDTIAAQFPVNYTGAACNTALAGTPAESANPDHMFFSHDGDTLFVLTAGGFGVDTARVDQVLVIDTSSPGAPTQLASITAGESTSHSSGALDGPGGKLYRVDSTDGTITEIDVATRAVTRTLDVMDTPEVVSTFGTDEGPSEQTGPVE
jgi:hypothetical protein